jgi:hypothetical protein
MKTCELCGLPIPAERVAAVPETELCVQCKTRLERKITHRVGILLTPETELLRAERQRLNDEVQEEEEHQRLAPPTAAPVRSFRPIAYRIYRAFEVTLTILVGVIA